MTWFKQYLGSRSQSTTVNSNISCSKKVKYGVPQGSTLGPTLFIIFLNDLFYLPGIHEHKTIMYADDTVLFSSDTDQKVLTEHLQYNSNSIVRWCDMNLLTINESKTKFCLFNQEHSEPVNTPKCKGQPLGLVSSNKYLGADITSNLNMDEYVLNVS